VVPPLVPSVFDVLGGVIPGGVPVAPVSLPHAVATEDTSRVAAARTIGRRSRWDMGLVQISVRMTASSDDSRQHLRAELPKCRTALASRPNGIVPPSGAGRHDMASDIESGIGTGQPDDNDGRSLPASVRLLDTGAVGNSGSVASRSDIREKGRSQNHVLVPVGGQRPRVRRAVRSSAKCRCS
jgi:hypothetical protein